MFELSHRLSQTKPSATMAISQKAKQLAREGKDIISLSVGESDFPTPDHVIKSAHKAMAEGQTRYTAPGGMEALKEAVQDKFKRENALDYQTSEIIVSSGAKQVIFNAFAATLNEGDEVLFPAPYWVSYPEMVKINGGTPIALDCISDGSFKLTPEALEKAITPKTKWLLLNSPSNPAGVVYSANELKALGTVLEKHPHILIMCDDIYEHILFDNLTFVTFAQACPHLKDRVLTINGVSKAYSMTGWRIGYGAGPEKLIKAMTTYQSQSTSNPCSISQAAAIEALRGPQDYLKTRSHAFQNRRDLVMRRLERIKGLSAPMPQGAFYAFIDCRPYIETGNFEDDISICSHLLEKTGVALVPGTPFGAPGFFRLSFALNEDNLRRALDYIEDSLHNI